MSDPLTNERWLAHIRDNLDQQSQQTSIEFEQQLHELARHARQTRQQRLAQTGRSPRLWWFGGLSLAMGLAVILLQPLLNPQVMSTALSQTPITQASTMLSPSVDPEFLEDMEMVIVLGEDYESR
ncbi:hypothetical protein [Agitococcus lubricus]|uniref:Uncharacterized protein n=1 Tax=Agitococcus lubricus TaxID=1077255 RepID=A0A2T5IZ97_9GAMM|nr:hypothetical protein [Agitococcus lubricus]PTQ89335.1 hypothetical protein C8N29_10768 [Agitococcus lubricus]